MGRTISRPREKPTRASAADQGLAIAEVQELRKKAISGRGVLKGNEMEYWRKGFFKSDE